MAEIDSLESSLSDTSLNNNSLDKHGAYVLVAAIDLGTTYSGYAFSPKADPDDIYIHTNWGVNYGIPHSYKTPTCVLTDAELEFVAMGYEAKMRYTEMSQEEATKYRYFEGFKMSLHSDKGVRRNTEITDSRGEPCQAIDIFAMILKELKRHLLQHLTARNSTVPDTEYIRWVVTVPAIWSDAAKQFMREAAVKGGLIEPGDSHRLVIALEPEVASLYCRTLPLLNFSSSDEARELKAGDKYIVLDIGGGTLDITAHQLQKDGRLVELHHANGGAMGASQVNQNFLALLDNLFTHQFIDRAMMSHPSVIIQLLHSFEATKRGVHFNAEKPSAVPLNMDIGELYRDLFNEPLQKSIKPEFRERGVRIASGLLQLPQPVVAQLFTPVIDEICHYVKELLEKPALQNVQTVLMVGGFSDCSLLQQAIRKELGPNYNFLIPKDSWSAVLKGAAYFGHKQDIVRYRRAKVTYGIEETPPFDPDIHHPDKMFFIHGEKYADAVFEEWVKQGEKLEKGFAITKTGVPIYEDQDAIDLDIYISTNVKVVHTSDPGVFKVGHLKVNLPGKGLERKFDITMKFGGTEIEVEARDVRQGGEVVNTVIDFLFDDH